jgi:hypothetical protein
MASISEASREAFTFIDRTEDIGSDGEKGPPQLFPKYGDLTSGKLADPVLHLLEDLRAKYPEYVVTYVDPFSLNLLAFAFAGFATATLDIETDSVFRMRAWLQPSRRGTIGQLAEARGFAKYQYRWGNEDFILYCITIGFSIVQYVLKERGPGEGPLSHSAVTDSLLAQVGLWSHRERKGIYVYDMIWRLDEALYEQVQKLVLSADYYYLIEKLTNDIQSLMGQSYTGPRHEKRAEKRQRSLFRWQSRVRGLGRAMEARSDFLRSCG